jgi:peptide/nickel transport system substrate-binding protein
MRVISELNTALLALKKGEIDEMELSAEQWVNQTNDESFYEQNTKASGVEWTTYLFTWNLSTPFFSDVRVRKAMGYAFNHKELLEKQNFGLFEAANGPYHQTSWMSPKPGPAPYTQDLDKAEALLDEAGWVDSDNDGIRDKLVDGKRVKFEFSIICTPVEERKKLCTLLKDNLGQIGVICNVSPLDFAVLQERTVEHNFQAAFGGWRGLTPTCRSTSTAPMRGAITGCTRTPRSTGCSRRPAASSTARSGPSSTHGFTS